MLGNPSDTQYKSTRSFRSAAGSRYKTAFSKENTSAGGGDVQVVAFP